MNVTQFKKLSEIHYSQDSQVYSHLYELKNYSNTKYTKLTPCKTRS